MLSRELSLDGKGSLGEATFAEIVRRFKAGGAKQIVEFGSGVSTARLAREFPSGEILSVEHSREFLLFTSEYLDVLGAQHRVTLDLRPVRWRRVGAAIFLTYTRGWFPDCVDAVLVDGPPGWMHRGREACLYDIWDSLRVGGVLVLDDYQRPSEHAAGEAWKAALGDGAEFEEVPLGHGLLAVRKKKRCRPVLWHLQLARSNLISWWCCSRSIAAPIVKRMLR